MSDFEQVNQLAPPIGDWVPFPDTHRPSAQQGHRPVTDVAALEDDLAWHKEALAAYTGKLESVWEGIAEAVTSVTGKPGSSEPFNDLYELLNALKMSKEQFAEQSTQLRSIAEDAIDLMTDFHSHAEPDGTPDMNPVFPACEFRKFVDSHANLMYRLAQLPAPDAEARTA